LSFVVGAGMWMENVIEPSFTAANGARGDQSPVVTSRAGWWSAMSSSLQVWNCVLIAFATILLRDICWQTFSPFSSAGLHDCTKEEK
jgi:hypothetical protein